MMKFGSPMREIHNVIDPEREIHNVIDYEIGTGKVEHRQILRPIATKLMTL